MIDDNPSLVPGVEEERLVHTDVLLKMALVTFMTFTLFRGVCSDEIYAVNFPTWPSLVPGAEEERQVP